MISLTLILVLVAALAAVVLLKQVPRGSSSSLADPGSAGIIGRETIRIAKGFGMDVLGFDIEPDEDAAGESRAGPHGRRGRHASQRF